MVDKTTEKVTQLMKVPERIRNIGVCAHIFVLILQSKVQRSWK